MQYRLIKKYWEELTEEQQEWLMAYETLNYCGIVDLDDEVRPMFCLD